MREVHNYERFGWLMFLLSGVFFLVLGLRERDVLTVMGAVAWMLGCVAFLATGRP